MFGCCVAGRLLQTNLQQIDETKAAFELPAAETINHICVFLLGTVPFPDGYGATVHFFWPGKGFQLLGMLSNEKPSAIFRLRGNFVSQSSSSQAAFSNPEQPTTAAPGGVTAVLGISIEPLPQILEQVSALPSAVPKPVPASSDGAILAEKNHQAPLQLYLRFRVGERHFLLSGEYGSNECDREMVREFLVEG